ncbi:MAG: hypothetical protein Q7S84_01490 [bacterium]|nr:hypothetical protein [bacterium]
MPQKPFTSPEELLHHAKQLVGNPADDLEHIDRGEQSVTGGPEGLVEEAKNILSREGFSEVESHLTNLLAKRSSPDVWKKVIDHTATSLGWTPAEVERGVDCLVDALKEYRKHRPSAPDEINRTWGSEEKLVIGADTFASFAKQYLSSRFSPAVAERLFPLIYFYAQQTGETIRDERNVPDVDVLGDSEAE